jgi:predicted transcriptional regulator
VARDAAKRSALRHLLNTFFEGSTTQAIAALLDEDASRLDHADWDRLNTAIKRARKEGA